MVEGGRGFVWESCVLGGVYSSVVWVSQRLICFEGRIAIQTKDYKNYKQKKIIFKKIFLI